MGTTSYSKQNMRNDSQGEWYQEIAAEFYSQLFQEELTQNHQTQGIDLIFPSQKIEVKGMGSLLQRTKKGKNRYHIRHWKIDQEHVNRETTFFSFVLFDEILFPDSILFSVEAALVYERLDQYSNSKWVWFPLWWVLESHIAKYSRLPWNSDPPVKYEFKHTNEIPELVRPPLEKTLAGIFNEKNYSLDELEFLQDFFIEFSQTSWFNNPIIVEFIASIEGNLETKSNGNNSTRKRFFSVLWNKVRNFLKL